MSFEVHSSITNADRPQAAILGCQLLTLGRRRPKANAAFRGKFKFKAPRLSRVRNQFIGLEFGTSSLADAPGAGLLEGGSNTNVPLEGGSPVLLWSLSMTKVICAN